MSQSRQHLTDLESTEQYVGLIDVLGWSESVLTDFDNAVKVYDEILEDCEFLVKEALGQLGSLRVFSDSILLVSDKIAPILHVANALQFVTLFRDCLLRGSIARGKHIELDAQSSLYVVSEALVRAAAKEKEVKKPCIVLDSTAEPTCLPADFKLISPFLRVILFFEGIWIVNPFNIMWGTSAAKRVTQLKKQFPEHSDEYDWFLRLYKAIKSGQPLVPDDAT